MASQGDIVQVSLEMLWANITVMRNVFYYRVADPPTGSYLNGLDTDFQSVVLSQYAPTQGTAYTFTSVEYLNLFTGDVVTNVAPVPAAGTRTLSGDPSPSFMAAMIVLERGNNRVRNGRKFIFAPSEADVTGNGLAAGFLTLLGTLKNRLIQPIVAGGLDTFQPCIVGRIPYTTPSGKIAYRLPNSQAEMGDAYSDVTGGRVVNRTTTMNSRKYWRGE